MENAADDNYGEADRDVAEAKPFIEDIITQQKVVTDRELKVRLEDRFFPWVTGRALNVMESEGTITRVRYPGRKRKGAPESFHAVAGVRRSQIDGVAKDKMEVSRDINAILTRHAPAGAHAEDLFEQAFSSLGFDILARDASEYGGRHVSGVEGKEPPNLDFIVERDQVVYGVDIKNWIRYEYGTRAEVVSKVNLAVELGVVPFIIARYVDKDMIYRGIIERGGICYLFRTLLVPPSFDSLATRAGQLLGYPVLAVDWLPRYKVMWLDTLHRDFVGRRKW